jgi:tight adherence protein B
MGVGKAFGVLALIVIVIAIFFLIRSTGDQRREKISARLRQLAAPIRSKALSPDVEILSPDPILKLLPPKMRARADKLLGSTGYQITLRTLALVSVTSALVVIVLFGILVHISPIIVLVLAIAAALGLPWFVIQTFRGRHSQRFVVHFPDAIDLIVRAVRAGLPVMASMEAAGQETPDPVGPEFKRIIADTRIGITLEEALHRAAARVMVVEFNFFVVTLTLQRESGGNLTETLATLSSVLRRRSELRAKTRALTAEARLSAMVLAAMPLFTAGAIAVINPGYFKPMFADPRGGYILGAAILNLSLAMLTMRTMLRRTMG